ncbi:MAG: ferritin-like domain-containing protein [Dehalococcoidales bacterium]
MDKKQTIALLNKDLEDEHGAIGQYLSHAYAMGEGEMACEIEAIAREEMRHLDWLAEKIVELGGQPSLERGHMIMGGQPVKQWMENDVRLEKGAIEQYRQHIGLIEDKGIKRLLERILSDEESHRMDFGKFILEAQEEGVKDLRGSHSDDTIKALNWGIEHEYTVILQYLFQSYMTTNREAKKQFEDQAVNEMQHLGWLAEKIVGRKGSPVMKHKEVDTSTDLVHGLKADVKIERQVAEAYDKYAVAADDPGVKKLLLRLRDHELYHAELFSDLLMEEQFRREEDEEEE